MLVSFVRCGGAFAVQEMEYENYDEYDWEIESTSKYNSGAVLDWPSSSEAFA